MIPLAIVGVAVLVTLAVVWARAGAARSASKSVETYERGLGALGDVTKRTESTGFRMLPHDEAGRPHVATPIDETVDDAPARPGEYRPKGQGPLAAPPLPPAGEPAFRVSGPVRPAASASSRAGGAGGQADDGLADDVAPRPPDSAAMGWFPGARGRVPGSGRAGKRYGTYRSSSDRRRQVLTRRAATGVVAGVAILAIAGAAIALSNNGGRHAASSSTTTTVHRGGGGRSSTTTTTTTLPTVLKPTSVSPTEVAFTVPSASYTLTLNATTGSCWVGVEKSSAGPWLWMQTLAPGQSATYKGSGALVVAIGAPAYAGLSVNGIVAQLPSGATQPYDVDLSPAAG